MKLAFRTTAATDATLLARCAATGIKVRLVSRYCHGGIVVGDQLFHATAHSGLCRADFTAERWDFIDMGQERDAHVLALFEQYQGTKYDWLGLVPFIAPLPIGRQDLMYCFEWQWLCLTGEFAKGLVTPELILRKAIELRGI